MSMYEERAIGSYLSQTKVLDERLLEHSRSVAGYVQIMSGGLGFGPDETRKLERSSLLHDLGMLGVEREIRDKPGMLTPGEWAVVKSHPVGSAKVISFIPGLREIMPIVRHHHEWYDGTGYPDGLRGDRIPLLSRIISIADSYDAMTHDRPYRAAMSHEEVLKTLYDRSAIQFDPELLEIFIGGVLENQKAPSPS